MQQVYLDEQLIAAFFDKRNPNFTLALAYLKKISLAKEVQIFSSLNGLISILQTARLSFINAQTNDLLDKKMNIEQEILNRLLQFANGLNLKIINPQAFDFLKRSEYLQKKHKLSFENAMKLALMIENGINTLATLDREFNKLFAEKLVSKF